ncbi:MAG: hypothetical protein AB7U82_24355 [Blastocatellales bacterium]
MAEIECLCEKFERLEGVAVQDYVSRFLEETGVDEETGKTYYSCKICGTPWTRVMPEGSRKPSLVRMETEFNV